MAQKVKIPSIDELVDGPLLQEHLDSITQVMEIPVRLLKNNRTYILSEQCSYPPICDKFFRNKLEECPWCELRDFDTTVYAILNNEDGLIEYNCLPMIEEFGSYISVNGKKIAAIIAEKRKSQELNISQLQDFAQKAGLDSKTTSAFIESVQALPAVSMEKMQSAQKLIAVTANTISQLADKEFSLHHITKEMETINEIGIALNRSPNMDSVIQLIIDRVVGLTGAYDSTVFLWDESKRALVTRATKGVKGGIGYVEISEEKGVTNRALRKKKAQRVHNVKEDPDYVVITFPAGIIKSELAIPLILRDIPIGVLDVQSEELGHFTKEHERILTTLAQHITAAIQNIRSREDFDALSAVEDAIKDALELEDTIAILLQNAVKLTSAEDAWLRLVNRKKEQLILKQHHKGKFALPPLNKWQGISGYVWQTKEPYLCHELEKDTRYLGFPPNGSLLSVPILSRGVVIGVLNVWSPEIDRFTLEHQRMLSAFAKQASVAIEKANAVDAILEVVTQVYQLDEPDFFRLVVKEALDLVKIAEGCTIWLLDEDKKEFRYADVGEGESFYQRLDPIPLDQNSFCKYTIEQKKPIVISDVKEPKWWSICYHKEIAEEKGLKSLLAVPIFIGEKPIGVFTMQTTDYHQFTNWEKNVLRTFVTQVAASIENARLIGELRKLNKYKRELIRNLAHELKTPLTPVIIFLEKLINRSTSLSDRDKYFAKIAHQELLRYKRLVDKILTFPRIRDNRIELHKESLILSDVLQSSIDFYIPFANKKHINLQFSIDLENDEILADRDSLVQIFTNVLDNAIKYTPNGGIVQVSLEKQDDDYQVKVTDNGIGISKIAQQHLFEPYRSGDDARPGQRGGLGIGLYMVKYLVEAHGGFVTTEIEFDVGSTFTLTLPKRGGD